ncbi:MAG: hypothetical protein QOI21_2662 [Actinomycetota bacterium]|nr:hypothetical protein [Actinomycetota bacterium]
MEADLFLTLRVLNPEGKDVTFVSALTPGEVAALDIEIWPTSVVIPRATR